MLLVSTTTPYEVVPVCSVLEFLLDWHEKCGAMRFIECGICVFCGSSGNSPSDVDAQKGGDLETAF